jgi:hypothetical protein
MERSIRENYQELILSHTVISLPKLPLPSLTLLTELRYHSNQAKVWPVLVQLAEIFNHGQTYSYFTLMQPLMCNQTRYDRKVIIPELALHRHQTVPKYVVL